MYAYMGKRGEPGSLSLRRDRTERPTIQFTYNSRAASMWDDAGRRTRDEDAYVGIRQGETMQSETQ